mmetsp:Transcript_16756/g.38752  ORF Transcript_16756/g.38752 Transcript_16756/m.38752 type:complete len:660 (+) Transcript_16756:34-2013(+)
MASKLPVEEIKRRLISIYSIFKTENVSKVDHLLQKYGGQEEFLYQTVCSKYQVDERAFAVAAPPLKAAPANAPLAGVHPSAWAVPKAVPAPAVLQLPPTQAGPEAIPAAPWSKSSPMQRTAVLHQDATLEPSESLPQQIPVKAHPPDASALMTLPALGPKAPPPAAPQLAQQGTSMAPPSDTKLPQFAAPPALPVKAPPRSAAPAQFQPSVVSKDSLKGVLEEERSKDPSSLQDHDEDVTMVSNKEEQEAFFALVRAASTAEAGDGLETRKSGGSNPHNTDVSSAGTPTASQDEKASPPLKKQKLAATNSKRVDEQQLQPLLDVPKLASNAVAPGDDAVPPEAEQNVPLDEYDAEDSVLGDDEDARLQEALWAAVHADGDANVEDAKAPETTATDIVDIDLVLLGERSGFFESIDQEMQGGGAAESDEGNASDESGSSSSEETDDESEGSADVAENVQAEPQKPVVEDPARLAPATGKPVVELLEAAVAPAASTTAGIPNGAEADIDAATVMQVLKDGYGTDPSSSEVESGSESSDSGSEAKVGGIEEHAQRWRLHVGGQIFAALDTKHAGRLRNGEMQKFARFSGFDGTKEEWTLAYLQLCEDQQCKPKEGITQAAFLRLINDESDRGCYCSNAELRSMCESIAPAALQVMEAPTMGA